MVKSQLEHVRERIREKQQSYTTYNFKRLQEEAFATFFDLAQEYTNLDTLYLVCTRRIELLALLKDQHLKSRIADSECYPVLDIGLKAEDCDLCEICCKLCPTGALSYAKEGHSGSISFHMRKCTACRLCVEICPLQVQPT